MVTIQFLLEHKYNTSYVLILNIYAEVGSQDDVHRVRTLMKDKEIKKTLGQSV